MSKNIKILNISLISAIVISLLLSMTVFSADCDDLKSNTLRLHIKANSDSEYDQNMKLFVRDAVLTESEDLFLNAHSLEDAVTVANENIEGIKEIAQNAVRSYGSRLPVAVSVEKRYFNTRVYDDFTLPAGEYNSLCIDIGNAAGHNWWCVIFPTVCIGAAGRLSDTVGKGGVDIAENPEKFVVKFKIIEIYELIKSKFAKN